MRPRTNRKGPGGAVRLFLLVLVLIVNPWALGGEQDWYFESPSNGVINLLLGGLKSRTRVLYKREFDRFLKATVGEQRWSSLSHEPRDYMISHYLVKGYHASDPEDKISRTQAGYLVTNLRYIDPLSSYALSHRVCGVWRSRDPPCSAWPVTRQMSRAIAGAMREVGERVPGLCVMFTFSNLLRIGESLKVKWGEIYLPAPRGEDGAIYLPESKTGAHQYVALVDQEVIELLRQLKALVRGQDHERVFPFAYNRFRLLFVAAIAALGLNRIPGATFRSHSLRRGGATHLLNISKNPEYCAVIGRWANLRSCRRYLKQGEALVARLVASMSADIAIRLAAMEEGLNNFFA